MDLGLDGKTFIVTGGTAGPGLATVRALIAEGANALVTGRTEEKFHRARESLTDGAHRIAYLAGDNADPDLPRRLKAAVMERCGRLDGLLVSVGGPPAGKALAIPDETWRAADEEAEEPRQLALFDLPRRKPVKREVRPLVTPRSELRPLYLNTQGMKLGKSGTVLQVKDKEKLVQEVRLGEICQVNLMGNVQITTQAIQALCEAEVPVCYFSMGGWFYGITLGLLAVGTLESRLL